MRTRLTFLTQAEIIELKDIRAELVNDAALKPIIKFLSPNKLSCDDRVNKNSFAQVLRNWYLKNLLNDPKYYSISEKFKANGGNLAFEYNTLFDYLDHYPPIYKEMFEAIWNLNMLDKKIHVQSFLANKIGRTSNELYFDFNAFLIDPSYDLEQFKVHSLEAELVETVAILNESFEKIYRSVVGKAPLTAGNSRDQFVQAITGKLNITPKPWFSQFFMTHFENWLLNRTDQTTTAKDADYRESLHQIQAAVNQC